MLLYHNCHLGGNNRANFTTTNDFSIIICSICVQVAQKGALLSMWFHWRIGRFWTTVYMHYFELSQRPDGMTHMCVGEICHNRLFDTRPLSQPRLTLLKHTGTHGKTHFNEIWMEISFNKLGLKNSAYSSGPQKNLQRWMEAAWMSVILFLTDSIRDIVTISSDDSINCKQSLIM